MEFFFLKNRKDIWKDIDVMGIDKVGMVFENVKEKLNEEVDEEKVNWNV